MAIGLSGGMDSRLLLASVLENKDIDCYIYGNEEFYETAIARRCACVAGAHSKSFPAEKNLFPDRKDLMAHVYATEAVDISLAFQCWKERKMNLNVFPLLLEICVKPTQEGILRLIFDERGKNQRISRLEEGEMDRINSCIISELEAAEYGSDLGQSPGD